MNALLLLSFSFFGQTTLDDGSLIFLEKCNFFVERYTHAPIGHVAVAVNDDNHTWIYEATPGKVRRLTWDDYKAELSTLNADRKRKEKDPIITWVLEPDTPLLAKEQAKLKRFLDSQLNRRYSVRGIVRGKTGDGIHCAELASHALNTIGRANIEDCHKQSPAAVMEVARDTSEPAYQVAIARPMAEESWCDRAWRRWTHWGVMCRWSCGEAWRFCW